MGKRSTWKSVYIDSSLLTPRRTKIQDKILSTSRSSQILPFLIHKVLYIHNGKNFHKIQILPPMLGHKLGEFAPTRSKYEFKKKRKKPKKT